MNYNALLLLDKNRKYRNNYSTNVSNLNQYSLSNQKINNHLNIHTNLNQKYKKCFSVKPSLYTMPKDIMLKDIFKNSIKYSEQNIKKYQLYNNNNKSDIYRHYIFEKIKKFISINNINNKIFAKTIYLYDYILFEKERINKNNKKYAKFFALPNLSIALIAFILSFKFNYVEKKMISLKSFVKNFEEKDENITFNDVCEMEIVALQLLDYNLTFLTPFSYMELFLLNGIIFNDDHINSDLSFNIYELVNETLENIMVSSNEYFKYNYFYLCCSTVMYVREKFNIVRWPKALEMAFNARYDQFYDIYNNFFANTNKKDNKNNIRGSINSNIINISNLKSMANIISVLKIMKSADKYRKTKDKINKSDCFHLKEEKNKEDNCKDKNNNNNVNIHEDYSSIIKVGLNKKWNFSTFKSPGKHNIVKSTLIFSSKQKLNEETRNKENEDFMYNNKTIERVQIKNINSGEFSNKEENYYSSNITEKNNINITKSCSRYRKTVLIINKINPDSNNPNKINNNSNSNNNNINNNITTNNISNLDSCYNNNNLNINYYKKRRFMEKKGGDLLKSCPEISKEMKNDNLYNNKTNSININKNYNYNCRTNNRYYNNNTEKKRNIEYNKSNDLKINQTSFNNFIFHKDRMKKQDINNDTDNDNYLDNYRLKNKEENSNAPTCESSNNKLSLNDYSSIRRSYRYKKIITKNEETEETLEKEEKEEKEEKKEENEKEENEKEEKEEKNSNFPENEKNKRDGKKILEKNKSFNKLINNINNKMTFSDNTYNRRTGVRKYYKQKKSRDYH